ncbi:MAG: phenylphosphate carboxylase subunit gamma [Chloroflexi bacterium]|nr:phenylphosphate carboxylase subunit gamma [Chloroflexota bacterium]
MKKEFETFVDSVDALPLGREIDLEIRTLEPGKHKYEIKTVRAVIEGEAAKLKGADVLRVRLPLGEAASGTWAIKIVRELPAA